MAYVVDSAFTGGGAVTNTLMNMPAHQVDDLLIMFTVMNAGNVTIDTAGWTAVSNNATAGTANTSSFTWKRATTATETLQIDTTDDFACLIVCVRDADVGLGAAVINASSHLGTATSISSHTSVSVTTTQPDCLVLYFIGVDGTATASHANPGVHHISSVDNGGANAAAAATNAAAWTIKRTAGAIPAALTATWTSSLAGTAARLTVAIRNVAGGRIPAYIDAVAGSPATTISPCHHYSPLNNIAFTTTFTATATINSKTLNAVTGAAQADLGIVPFSSGIATATATVVATQLRGFEMTLTGNRNMSNGLLVGSYIGATPKMGAFGLGSVSEGGCVVRIGSGATNWEAYQVAARDSVPNLVNRCVWAIRPGYRGSTYGTPSTNATNTAAVSFIQFFFNSPSTGFLSHPILSEVYLATTQIIAGGTALVPVDTEGVADVGRSFRLPVIQQTGAAGLLSYVPIQIGGGDEVDFEIDAGSLQFPRRYDVAKKEIAFHAPDNYVGISYAGKSGDTIKHTNSVITSITPYYWEINAAATSACTWDFTGLTIVNATVTLRPVTTFNSMTFSECVTLNATASSVTNSSVSLVSTTNNPLTVSSTTSFSNCDFNTTMISAGVGMVTLTNTTGVPFSSCEFIGSGTTGHAIIITQPGTYAFSNLTFTGYGGTPGDNPDAGTGSTSAAVYNDSGGEVIIQATGGTQPSVRNGLLATTDVQTSADVLISNLIPGSEVRAYTGSINDPLNAVEIGGTESSTGTSFTFTQSSSGLSGYIQIFKSDLQPILLEPIVYSGTFKEYPVQQATDRQYENPA